MVMRDKRGLVSLNLPIIRPNRLAKAFDDGRVNANIVRIGKSHMTLHRPFLLAVVDEDERTFTIEGPMDG